MTDREALIHSVEKAGIKMTYYLDTRNEKYMDEAIMYVRAANTLLNNMEKNK